MKKVLPLIIVLFSAINIYSQYKGGVGDGHSSDITTNISKIVINAGIDITICGADTVTIGTAAGANKTYSWTRLGSPTVLANTAIYKFYASTLGINKYILKVDSMFCSVYDTVTVRVNPPMSELSVSTGYIANTSTTIPYNPTPLRDNCWKVIQTPNLGNFRLPTDIAPYPSYVVLGSPSYNSVSVSDSRIANGQYISPNPSANAGNNLTPELPVIFQRNFSTSTNGSIRIIGELLADNYSELYLNNTLIKAQNTAQYSTNFLNPTPIDTVLSVNAGVHSLKINLRNSINADPLGVRFSGLLISCNTNIIDDNCYAAPPTVSAGPDQEICLGDSVLIGTPGIPETTYSWAILNGATFSTGNSQIKVAPTATTTYVLTGCNSGGTQSDNVTVTVNPKPDATISGIFNVCTDSEYYYSVPNIPGNIYEWSVTGGMIVSGTNDRFEIRIRWGAIGTGTISVRVTNQFSCESYSSSNITINALPTASITYPNPLCAEIRTVTPIQTGQTGGFYSIQPTNLAINAYTGAINITNTTIGTYTITYDIDNGTCGNSITTQIIINPIPTASIISATNTCAGQAGQGTISTNSSMNGISYQLFNNADNSTVGLPLSGTGESLNWELLNSGTYYVIATDLGSNCVSSRSNNATISEYPSPIALLNSNDADNTICNGETITFTASGGVNYEFFINSASQGTPSTTNTLTLNTPINGQTVKVKVYDTNGCSSESAEIIINVFAAPITIATPASQAICSGSTTSIALSSVGNPAGITYSWNARIISGNVSGYSNGLGSSIIQTLTNSGSIPAIVRYAAVSRLGGCFGDTTFIDIVVAPKPVAVATPTNQTICSGGTTAISISTTGIPIGISYSWTAKIINGSVNGFANGTGNTINQVLINSGNTQAIVRYAIVPKVGTCIGDTVFADVTISPKPNIIPTPISQTICSGETTGINLSTDISSATITYSWTAKIIGGIASGFSNGSGSNISQTLTNTGSTTAIVQYAIVPNLGLCRGDTVFVNITINPKPDAIVTPLSQTINNGGKTNISISSGVTEQGIVFSWTAQLISGNATGFTNSTGNLIAQTLTNSGTTPAIVRYAIVPKFGSCYGDTVYVNITINPTADVIIHQNADAICNGGTTDIQLSTNSPSTNVNYSWIARVISGTVSGHSDGSGNTITQSLVNSGRSPAIVSYTINPIIDGISGRAAVANVTVYPTPTFNATPETQTILSGEKTSIILSTEISGVNLTLDWSAILLSGTASGFTSGAGNSISQGLINSGTTPAIVQYTITPKIGNCLGTPKTVNVTVNPIIKATATPNSQTICSGETTAITLSSNISGAEVNYTWNAIKLSGAIEGNSNGQGDKITQTLTNSGNTPAIVQYTITPKIGDFTGNSIQVEITVLPQAIVNASPISQTISSGDECNIALSSNVSGIGVVYEWTSSCSSPNISGYSNGSGNRINQTLINSGNKPETVQYIITPKVGNCIGTAKTVEVTVNPEADVIITQESDAICNEGTTNIMLSTNISGATVTYSWTASAQNTDVSGYSPGSGESINDVLINRGNTPQTVRYTIAPTINGVIGNSVVADVTVYPTPKVIINTESQTIANGQECDIQLSSNISNANVEYVWKAESISGTVSGYNDGNGNRIEQVLTNLGNTQAIVRYIIIPEIEGCLGVPDSVDITVNPLPQVTIKNESDTICHEGITNIHLSTPNSGVDVYYSWIASTQNDKISGYSDGNGDIISDALLNTDITPGKVTYTITPIIDGVSGTSVTTDVIVFPKPNAIATPDEQTIANGKVCIINISSDIIGTEVLYNWDANCVYGDADGYENGSGNSIIQRLTNSGNTTAIVRYVITPFIGACIGDPIIVNVSIDPEQQSAKFHIALDTVRVQIENQAKFHLKLLSSENLITEGENKQYKATISFNSSIMKPLFAYSIPEWQSSTKSYRTIEFTGGTDKSSGLLDELLFDTNLGNDTVSNVIIESVVWSDVQNEAFPTLDNGRIELSGICHENGPRLFEPSEQILLSKINPNPANDRIEIEFTLGENDKTELIIMNMIGEIVKTIPITTNTLGKRTEIILLDEIAQGQYLIILKTPTIQDKRIINIIR